MAGNDSSDQDMERLLRRHFADETPAFRAPTDTWTRLESRLEREQGKSPGRFTAFHSLLSQTWTGSRRLAVAGTAAALIAVVVLASVFTFSGSLIYEEPVGSVFYSGEESQPQGPEKPLLGFRDGRQPPIVPPVQKGENRITVEKETASTSAPEKSQEPTVPLTPAERMPREVAKEAPSPVATAPEEPTRLKEMAVENRETGTVDATEETTPENAASSEKPPLKETATENRRQARAAATQPPAATTAPMAMSGVPGPRGGAGPEGAAESSTARSSHLKNPSTQGQWQRSDRSGSGGSYAAPPDTTFKDYQRSRFTAASEDNVSTFSLDTDRTSYQLALNWARSGYQVDPASVRAEEWINAFDYQYLPPKDNDAFSIRTDLIEHPLDSGKHLARIAFQAPEVRDDAPLNVTLVLDSSGSMHEGNRVDIARAAAESIRRSLGPSDRIAVVQFSDDIVREAAVDHSHPDNDSVQRSIERLRPRGSTNVQAGIDLGVQMADQARRQRPEAHNYIILMSDGVANVDATNPFAILESAYDRSSGNPLRIITIGVGIQNYNDYLLEQLAQHGNGWYRYLNDVDAARQTFSRENWLAISTPFADQTRAQVTWDPKVVNSWRIIGYENRITPDETFTQDRKEFAEIPSGSATTVFYELELNEGAIWQERGPYNLTLGKVQLRWVKPGTEERRLESSIISGNLHSAFDTSPDQFLRLGAIVALASDRFSALSGPEDGLVPGVGADLFMLQQRLQMLKDPLGDLAAYKDLAFLLERMADGTAELAPDGPRSGYSR